MIILRLLIVGVTVVVVEAFTHCQPLVILAALAALHLAFKTRAR